jgi:hypothetical protein
VADRDGAAVRLDGDLLVHVHVAPASGKEE